MSLKNNDPKKYNAYRLILSYKEKYPLDDSCIFCGEQNEKLEHAHLDYEDDGYNYVTACHRCNIWMDNGKPRKKYVKIIYDPPEAINYEEWEKNIKELEELNIEPNY